MAVEAATIARPRGRGKAIWLASLLVALAVLLFALVLLRPFQSGTSGQGLSAADRAVINGGLRMLSPSFSGRTASGEPYRVEAEWALPNAGTPTEITLRSLIATITMSDGRDAQMTANRGVFRRDAEKIELSDGLKAVTSDGYVVESSEAVIDLANRRIDAQTEIVATGPAGSIRADTFEAVDGEERIAIFRGNVQLTFVPGSGVPIDR